MVNHDIASTGMLHNNAARILLKIVKQAYDIDISQHGIEGSERREYPFCAEVTLDACRAYALHFSAAVLQGFSCELLLKSLVESPRHTHDLQRLFNDLPDNIKNNIKTKTISRIQNYGEFHVRKIFKTRGREKGMSDLEIGQTFEISKNVEPFVSFITKHRKYSEEDFFRDLERHKDLFEKYRYSYEENKVLGVSNPFMDSFPEAIAEVLDEEKSKQ